MLTKSEIVKKNIFTYFNLIFAVLAALLIFAGSWKSLTFLPVVIANTVIGIVQELRAKKVLDELTVMNAPTARVERGGAVVSVPVEELAV
ncbi:MAG: cation-translocating P-type ATPase, partial [Clostridia bacterium]|nr:cation-translocating P-type ATPase [Clostridia bacterium]